MNLQLLLPSHSNFCGTLTPYFASLHNKLLKIKDITKIFVIALLPKSQPRLPLDTCQFVKFLIQNNRAHLFQILIPALRSSCPNCRQLQPSDTCHKCITGFLADSTGNLVQFPAFVAIFTLPFDFATIHRSLHKSRTGIMTLHRRCTQRHFHKTTISLNSPGFCMLTAIQSAQQKGNSRINCRNRICCKYATCL